jgi:ligand-binding sensor domain-containing protein
MKLHIYCLIIFAFILIIPRSGFAGGKWEYYSKEDNPFDAVFTMCLDNKNDLMVSSMDERYLFINNAWTPIDSGNNMGRIRTLKCDSENTFWAASENGLWKYKKGKEVEYVDWTDYGGPWDIGFICGIEIDNNDNIWFTSRRPYLTKFDGKEFVNYNFMNIATFEYTNSYLEFDGDSTLWVITTKGILRFNTNCDPENMDYIHYTNQNIGFKKSPGYIIVSDDGKIWAINNDGEIAMFNGIEWSNLVIPEELYPNPWGNAFFSYPSCLLSDDKNIYFFFYESNYSLIYSEGEFRKLDFPSESLIDSAWVVVTDVAMDSSGAVWIGTLYHGIYKYMLLQNKVDDKEIAADFSDIHIRSIFPNPASTGLNAEFLCYPDQLDDLEIAIYDYMGNKVKDITDRMQLDNKSGVATLECSLDGTQNGLHFFCIRKGSEVKVKSLMILR